ncbi:hypothetical protein [Thiohalobacter thiocyanaticus]|uniref:Uncharacterized protein n=1 Tax=Thiohalobacter thiocyanaticus TaxID=585455 RepID=A0A426QDU8_9GAMM|nr:hypothetical protein [Thiohalobacter thiocyanaticus]RRQ19911.1 hypothetical protein D6C00_14190 [Thiohalobacter thiocyanaticus]
MSNSATQLEQLQRRFEAGNAVAAWEALQIVLEERPAALPDWLAEYLAAAAASLLTIEPDPGHLAGAVLEALSLAGNVGPSVFTQYRTQRRREAALEEMAQEIRRGTSPEMAAAEVGGRRGYSETTLMRYYREWKKSPGNLFRTSGERCGTNGP